MFDQHGTVTPVTVITVEPNVVVQVKTTEKDGYQAVQIGTGVAKKASKALKGHFRNLGPFRYVREFQGTSVGDRQLQRGDALDVSVFAIGDTVKVTGSSKG